MRILKGYSKAERRELEKAKDNGFLSVIALFCSIKRDDNNCHALYEKYYRDDTNGNNQMAKDIVDFYFGNAKFPEQKYYVHLIRNDDGGYLNINRISNWCTTGSCQPDDEFQTKFTEQEIRDIDPRYMSFIVPAEDGNE